MVGRPLAYKSDNMICMRQTSQSVEDVVYIIVFQHKIHSEIGICIYTKTRTYCHKCKSRDTCLAEVNEFCFYHATATVIALPKLEEQETAK